MLPLKEIITQLDEGDLKSLEKKLMKTRGRKYLDLLLLIRKGEDGDTELKRALDVNNSALSALKSRLYSKLQEYLQHKLEGKEQTQVESKPAWPMYRMAFRHPRESAMAALQKQEREYADRHELFSQVLALGALKKLSRNTSSYYSWSQQYNQAMAVAIASEKCDDLLMQFSSMLGTTWHSRGESDLELLGRIKSEIENYSSLYVSPHFEFLRGYINCAQYVFAPFSGTGTEEMEGMRHRMDGLLAKYPAGPEKEDFSLCQDYLNCLYYLNRGDLTTAGKYYKRLKNDAGVLFMIGNYATFPGRYFDLVLNMVSAGVEKLSDKLADTCIENAYLPLPTDEPNYISWMRFRALLLTQLGEYDDAVIALNRLQGDVNMRRYLHTDLELRSLQAFAHTLSGNEERAMNVIFNLGRKLRDLPDDSYENIKCLIRLLTMRLKGKLRSSDEMGQLLRNNFEFHNKGRYRIMETVNISVLFRNGIQKIRNDESA